MSMNLVLIDKKTKASYDLYQTPTAVTRECLAAGNTAGILNKYIEYIQQLNKPDQALNDLLQERAIGKAWEYVGLLNIEYDDAFKMALTELVEEENSVVTEHLDNLRTFLASHPTASFSMI